MRVRISQITPAVAEKFLKQNRRNRDLVQSKVDTYARDMSSGLWGISESAICFDTAGQLMNGQHRLRAVIDSGATIQSIIAEGMPPDALLHMDSGAARTFPESYKLSSGGSKHVTNAHAAVAKILLRGPADKTAPTRTELAGMMDKHHAAIDFGVSVVPGRTGLRIAHVQAVFARAYYHRNRAGVEAFCSLLGSGEIHQPVDRAASLLRDYALRMSTSSKDVRAEKYWKTENALDSYLTGNPITKLCAISDEAFPLPGEVKARRRRP